MELGSPVIMVTLLLVGWSLHFSFQLAVSAVSFHLEPEGRPVEKKEQLTWKRVNKKLKRILKRREIERLTKEANS